MAAATVHPLAVAQELLSNASLEAATKPAAALPPPSPAVPIRRKPVSTDALEVLLSGSPRARSFDRQSRPLAHSPVVGSPSRLLGGMAPIQAAGARPPHARRGSDTTAASGGFHFPPATEDPFASNGASTSTGSGRTGRGAVNNEQPRFGSIASDYKRAKRVSLPASAPSYPPSSTRKISIKRGGNPPSAHGTGSSSILNGQATPSGPSRTSTSTSIASDRSVGMQPSTSANSGIASLDGSSCCSSSHSSLQPLPSAPSRTSTMERLPSLTASNSRCSTDTGGHFSSRTSGDRSSADLEVGVATRSHHGHTSSSESSGLESYGGGGFHVSQDVIPEEAPYAKPTDAQHPLYGTLAVASLSTPELHHSSDPMMASMAEELDMSQLYRRAGRISMQLFGRSKSKREPKGRMNAQSKGSSERSDEAANANGKPDASAPQDRPRKQSLDVHHHSSTGSIVYLPQQPSRSPASSISTGGTGTPAPTPRERKISAATIVRRISIKRQAAAPSPSSAPPTVTTHAAGTVCSAISGVNKSRSSSSNIASAVNSASAWLKRPRAFSITKSKGTGASTNATASAPAEPTGDASGSQIRRLASSALPTDRNIDGVDARYDQAEAKEKLRAARRYLHTELVKIQDMVIPQDKRRIQSLVFIPHTSTMSSGHGTGDEDEDAAAAAHEDMIWAEEQLELWKSIEDGVLLCLLANKLCQGSIEKIDRRDVEWVKADNISRFLKAARDELGVASRDLFQCFDITDSTTEGLQRAVLTILAIEHVGPSSSKGRRSGLYMQPRPTSLQRLNANSLASRSSLDMSFDHSIAHAIAESPPDATPARAGSAKVPSLSIQQQRREAERILVSGHGSSADEDRSSSTPAAVKARRRRSAEAYGTSSSSSHGHRSITFADSVEESSASVRTPYRDRKLSESAVSLGEVAEEEAEEVLALPVPQVPPPLTPELEGGRLSFSTPTPAPGMTRSSSQRRISIELQLGSAGLSSESLVDWRVPGSPMRPPAQRRNSGVGKPSPSILGTVRDQTLVLPAGRMPFPRSLSQNDSSAARRLARHVSLSGAHGVGEGLVVPSSPSPKPYLQRPAHHWFSTELPLTRTTTSARSQEDDHPSGARANGPVPPLVFPRPRYDTEVTTNSTPTRTEDQPGLQRTASTPAPRPKLVVSEPGEIPVIYVSLPRSSSSLNGTLTSPHCL